MNATMTTSISVVHRWNALLCPPIGLLANFLLILLVLTKTPKEMRQHSRILLQTGIIDILLLLLTIFGQPTISYQQNMLLLIFDGFLIDCFTNDAPLRIFSFIWFFFTTFNHFGPTVQFIYRYLVLNRGFKINLYQYLEMLSILFVICTIFELIPYFLQIPTNIVNIDSTNDELISALYKNGSVKYATIVLEESWLLKMHDAIFMLFSLLCFGIIAFCGRKMSRYVNSQLTGHKKELGRQLNRTLIIMAFLPFSYLIIANLIVIANILSKERAKNEENGEFRIVEISISLLVHWIPVLNPLVTILTNMPYRRAVFRAMTRKIVPAPATG